MVAFVLGQSITAPLNEGQILTLLVQLVLLVGVARLFGWAFRKVGQPAVVGELLAGIALGPSVLGKVAPETFESIFADPDVSAVTFGLAWLGVIMLLVVIGFETNLGIIARYRSAALFTAAGALLIPLAALIPLSYVVPGSFVGEGVERAIFAAFFGLALSVAALPVVAKILLDLNLIRRNFAQVTLAAGMTMDSVGWLVLAALSGIAQDGFQPARVAGSFLGLIVFVLVAATLGRWLLDRLFRAVMVSGQGRTTAAVSITLVAALVGGAITQALHLEAILGAFVVGVVAAATRHQLPQVRSVLETVTAAFFAPVFFAFSGLRVDIWLLDSPTAIAWTVGLILVSIILKMVGSAVGGWLGGIRGREVLALGSGLSALGAVGIVVAIVGLNLGVVSEAGYTVMIIAALVTSIIAPQLLKAVVSRWEIPPDEAQRLEREELQAASELLGRKRILIPTRGGANSAYAARLVASVFPEAEKTVMVVDLAPRSWWGRLLRRPAGEVGDPSDVVAELEEPRMIRRLARDPAAAISAEAKTGYDLIVVGATETGEGTFSTVVDRILALVEIPTIVVRFPDESAERRLPSSILVPVTATRSTRAAEEFAYSLARSAGSEVTALHVVNRPSDVEVIAGRAPDPGLAAARELVGNAAAFGDRLGVQVETQVSVAPQAEKEIIRVANTGEHELLVLGTNPRSFGDRPFFGHRVSYMLSRTRIPVVVISLPSMRVPTH